MDRIPSRLKPASNYYYIYNGNLQGVVNNADSIVLQPVFTFIYQIEDEWFLVKQEEKGYFFIDTNGTELDLKSESLPFKRTSRNFNESELIELDSGTSLIIADSTTIFEPLNLGSKFVSSGKNGLDRSYILYDSEKNMSTVYNIINGVTSYKNISGYSKHLNHRNPYIYLISKDDIYGIFDYKFNELCPYILKDVTKVGIYQTAFIAINIDDKYRLLSKEGDWLMDEWIDEKPNLIRGEFFIEYENEKSYLSSITNGLLTSSGVDSVKLLTIERKRFSSNNSKYYFKIYNEGRVDVIDYKGISILGSDYREVIDFQFDENLIILVCDEPDVDCKLMFSSRSPALSITSNKILLLNKVKFEIQRKVLEELKSRSLIFSNEKIIAVLWSEGLFEFLVHNNGEFRIVTVNEFEYLRIALNLN